MEKTLHYQSVELLEVLQKTMYASNYSASSIASLQQACFISTYPEKFGVDILICPVCKKGHLQLVGVVFPCSWGSPDFKPNKAFEAKTR